MTLPASGPISLLDVANEFGGAAPHSLNEYYGVASGVPASGGISLSDFHGKSALPSYTHYWIAISPVGVTADQDSSRFYEVELLSQSGAKLASIDTNGYKGAALDGNPSTSAFGGRISTGGPNVGLVLHHSGAVQVAAIRIRADIARGANSESTPVGTVNVYGASSPSSAWLASNYTLLKTFTLASPWLTPAGNALATLSM